MLWGEDHVIFRADVQSLIQPDMEIVGQAKNGPAAVELTSQLEPAVGYTRTYDVYCTKMQLSCIIDLKI